MKPLNAQALKNLSELTVLVLERELVDLGIRNRVAQLRKGASPVPWAKIGEALEVSTQAAQQKYGPLL